MKKTVFFILFGIQLFYASEIVAQLMYDKRGEYVEGIAMFILNNKVGYVDKSGKQIAPPVYDFGANFSEGMALVSQNRKVGYIDITGALVIPMIYDQGGNFKEGLASIAVNGRVGCVDKTGKEIIHPFFENIGEFKDGMAIAVYNKKYGYINKTGKNIIDIKYTNLGDFKEGLAIAVLNNKYGFVDKTGKEVVALKYDNLTEFKNEYSIVLLDTKYGVINKQGKEIIPLIYDGIEMFNENGLARTQLNGKMGVVTNKGKILLEPEYDRVDEFKNGISKVKQGETEVYLSTSGEIYDLYEALGKKTSLYKVKQKEKYGLLNEKGEEIISPVYSDIRNVSNNMLPVNKNDKWGFLNEKGMEVLPLKYDEVLKGFNNVMAKVRIGNQILCIDKTGNQLVANNKILYPILKNKKYGYMNNLGEIVIPAEYYSIKSEYKYNFSDGLIPVKSENQQWIYVDTTNKNPFGKSFKDAGIFSNGYACVNYFNSKNNDSTEVINSQGNTILKYSKNKVYEDVYNGFVIWRKSLISGFYDLSENKDVDSVFFKVNRFNEHVAVCEDIIVWKVIDKTGKTRVEFSDFDFNTIPNEDEYYLSYQSTDKHSTVFSNGLLNVRRNDDDMVGYINTSGKVVIDYIYKNGSAFKGGLAAVQKIMENMELKWGFINPDGKVIIPFNYVSVGNFEYGYAVAQTDNMWGVIDKTGNWVLTPCYKNKPTICENGLISVPTNNSWNYYNIKGELIYESDGSEISNTLDILNSILNQ